MKTQQYQCNNRSEFDGVLAKLADGKPNFIMIMASRDWFENSDLTKIKKAVPEAHVIGCSTAGEISNKGVFDNTCVINAVQFTKPIFKTAVVRLQSMQDSFECGKSIVTHFDTKRLSSMFILGTGLGINGTKLVEGIQSATGNNMQISGGLAGDGASFQKTFVLCNDQIFTDSVVALGVYDQSVNMYNGSQGGWMPFGPIRKVTKSVENVLFEIDGQPALKIYKEYLGERAKELPGAGLLFPLEVLDSDKANKGIIRTILNINEEDGSITFAGEITQNKFVRLMHAKNQSLIDGAKGAAEQLKKTIREEADNAFAVCISCVGRKLVMNEDIDEEVEAVKEVLETDNVIGFYSYGEICSQENDKMSKLHNQTMTITYFSETA